MKIDYFTMLSPEPISLSIGTIRHPTLRSISKLTFNKFTKYQLYLKMTAKDFCKYYSEQDDKSLLSGLADDEIDKISLYDILLLKDDVRQMYLEIFNYFFIERVIFVEGIFLILNKDKYSEIVLDELEKKDLHGIINADTFLDVIDLLQQVCCIKSKDPLEEVKPVFKNKKAERLYEKMLKANQEKQKKKNIDDLKSFSLPNIISSVASKSFGLNIINIWDATLFQIYDQFDRLRQDDAHYINSVRISVWGDEKNQFDESLWYKNNYD